MVSSSTGTPVGTIASREIIAMISVQGVSMRFGSKVLFDDVTTTFSAGRRSGLTGPNGAGEATVMKMLTGEMPPQRGTGVGAHKPRGLRHGQLALFTRRPIDTLGDG